MYRFTVIRPAAVFSATSPVKTGVHPAAGRQTFGEWGWPAPALCDWNHATNRFAAEPVDECTYVRLNVRSARSTPATSAPIGSSRSCFQPLNSEGKLERAGGAGERSPATAQCTRKAWTSRNAGARV